MKQRSREQQTPRAGEVKTQAEKMKPLSVRTPKRKNIGRESTTEGERGGRPKS
jgi:hypothetical protein